MLAPLLLVAVSQASTPSPAPSPADGERIDRILAEAHDPAATARHGRELAALGRASIPELFARLVEGRTEAGETLDEVQREAVLQGLAASGRGPLRSFLEPRVEDILSVDERAAIVELCGRFGIGADLGLTMLAAAPNPRGPISESVRGALGEAVSGILGRDPRAVGSLGDWMRRSSAEIAATLAVAGAEHPSAALLVEFGACLGFDPDLDPVLLSQIGAAGGKLDKPVSEDVARDVEGYLELDDPALLREAAMAVGWIEDFGATERLIELLGHEERGVREAANWALGRLSGMNFRSDGARWSAWLRSEELWFEEAIDALASRLEASESPAVVRTLGEVSVHRFQRHRLAQEVEAALQAEDPLVRRIACLCLARLGSSAAREGLARAAEDPDESVAAAARGALEAIGIPDPENEPGT